MYRTYWAAAGPALAASVLVALLLMQASRNVSDWWLSHWISELKSNASSLGGSRPPRLLLFSPGLLL